MRPPSWKTRTDSLSRPLTPEGRIYLHGVVQDMFDQFVEKVAQGRHMSTDDDIQSLVGHPLVRIETKPGPDIDADDDCHETCFVEISTDEGFITVVNHNEHNGYYGGFSVSISNIE